MTANAMFFEEVFKRLSGTDGTDKAKTGDEERQRVQNSDGESRRRGAENVESWVLDVGCPRKVMSRTMPENGLRIHVSTTFTIDPCTSDSRKSRPR